MASCDKHGHPLTADRYGYATCPECDYDARHRCTADGCESQGEARYSYRVYAGRYCDKHWASKRHGYRDDGENDRPDSDLDEPVEADA